MLLALSGFTASMPFELARSLIAIAGLAAGAYFDLFNDKNVPEPLLYAFLAVAFITNLLAYDQVGSIYAIASATAVFAAFYFLYRFGQIGGADAYMLASAALLLPLQPHLSPFLPLSAIPQLPFILNVILASGIFLMLHMLLRSAPAALACLKRPKKIEGKSLIGAAAILGAFAIFAYVSSTSGIVPHSYLLLMGALAALSMYFAVFKRAINDSMIEWTSYKGIGPEDIIAVDRMDKSIVRKYSLGRLVDSKMRERMKKIRGKKIALYKHLPPFIPHILLGLIASILFGNIILYFAGV